MSFQKKVISLSNSRTSSDANRIRPIPNASATGNAANLRSPGSPVVPGHGSIANKRPGIVGTPGSIISRGPIQPRSGATASTIASPPKPIEKVTPFEMQQHVAVRTSLHSADLPTITTGSPDLDRLLQHNGQPLGSLLLIEETGNTDFASVLLRSGAAQSVLHSRMKKDSNDQSSSNGQNTSDDGNRSLHYNTRVIVAGVDDSWGGELPGEYRDKKQAKKDQLLAEEKKISVQNLAASSNSMSHPNAYTPNSSNPSSSPKGYGEETVNQNMKIAWRYGTPNNNNSKQGGSSQDNKPHYVTPLDFTTRLTPGPLMNTEIEYLGSPLYFMSPHFLKSSPTSSFLSGMYNQIKASIIKALKTQGPHTVVRVLIPSFLHPATYPAESTAPAEAIRFIHSLAHLARTEFPFNAAIVVTLALELYPRETYLTRWLEISSDAVIHIEPFGERLETGSSATGLSSSGSNKSSSSDKKQKPYQGLVHVYKVPRLSEKGGMHVRRSEYAFRVSRKVFEIDEWGIPVEDGDDKEASSSSPSSSSSSGSGSSGSNPGVTTKKNLKNKKKESSPLSNEIDINEKEKQEEKKKEGPPPISQLNFKNLDF